MLASIVLLTKRESESEIVYGNILKVTLYFSSVRVITQLVQPSLGLLTNEEEQSFLQYIYYLHNFCTECVYLCVYVSDTVTTKLIRRKVSSRRQNDNCRAHYKLSLCPPSSFLSLSLSTFSHAKG